MIRGSGSISFPTAMAVGCCVQVEEQHGVASSPAAQVSEGQEGSEPEAQPAAEAGDDGAGDAGAGVAGVGGAGGEVITGDDGDRGRLMPPGDGFSGHLSAVGVC
jgi:hypothetical protein